jgi:UDP-N-acetylglucosamine transferase subunit ALG13
MILVTVGTSPYPFDRLLTAVATLGPNEDVVAQCGVSTVRPSCATCVDFLPPAQWNSLMQKARVTVMHAGVGSVAASLRHGKRPIIVPRLASHGEQIDDHQLHFARQLARAGLATSLECCDQLEQVVANEHPPRDPTGPSPKLIAELIAQIAPNVPLASPPPQPNERLARAKERASRSGRWRASRGCGPAPHGNAGPAPARCPVQGREDEPN